MDWASLTLKILEAGFTYAKLAKMEKANEHLQKTLELKRIIENEKRKPIFQDGMDQAGDYRDDSIIDNVISELRVLAEIFYSTAIGANIP